MTATRFWPPSSFDLAWKSGSRPRNNSTNRNCQSVRNSAVWVSEEGDMRKLLTLSIVFLLAVLVTPAKAVSYGETPHYDVVAE
jgi:hypothetical protein